MKESTTEIKMCQTCQGSGRGRFIEASALGTMALYEPCPDCDGMGSTNLMEVLVETAKICMENTGK